MRTRGRPGSLVLAALLAGGVLAAPVLVVGGHLAIPGTAATWSHLLQTVLPEYAATTLRLCLAVGAGAALLGTAVAWLIAAYDFPGKRTLEWALLLPLAVPTYVLAYAYTDLLQSAGTLQSWLRVAFGLPHGTSWVPDIRSPEGAAALFILALYPYVYLLARTAFLERAAGLQEAARALGMRGRAALARLALPLARPAVAAGVALAVMETLADFGAVSYFGVQTLTVGITRTWYTLGDRAAAGQLAAALLGIVVLVLGAERLSRGRARYAPGGGSGRRCPSRRLAGPAAAAASLACTLPMLLGFLVPTGTLLLLLAREPEFPLPLARFWLLARNSILVSGLSAALAVLLAILLGYNGRLGASRLACLLSRLVGLGYAVPGTVIAVGILIPVARLDHWLADLVLARLAVDPGLLLTGSIAALVYAYLVRYSAVALQTVEAGLARITPGLEDAARGLGAGQAETLRRVHLPLLRGSLLTAGLLVFVDAMKELPATLLMRPFNFDTLATQAFIFASDERLAELAAPSLAIVAVGLAPTVLLARAIAHRGAGAAADSPCHAAGAGRPRGGDRAAAPIRGTAPRPRRDRSAETTPPPILLEAVSRTYAPAGPTAVEGLSLAVAQGEILALLGPSGCGKTTTLRLIMGFEAPDAGRIEIAGRVVADSRGFVPPEARGIGMVFQDAALFPHLTVARNVGFGLRKLPPEERDRRTRRILELVNLEGLAARYPHELSGGQQQRVAVARALAPGYPIVLLDEPFSNLDAGLRVQLRGQLRRLLTGLGQTAVLVTHDREEAFEVADRIGILNQGRLEQLGTPEALYRRPASRFVARFLGGASFLPGTVRREGVETALGLLPGASGFAPGQVVEVLLRPEEVAIVPDPDGPATITERRFLGAGYLYTLCLHSHLDLQSSQCSTPALPLGARVQVKPAPRALVAFPGPAPAR